MKISSSVLAKDTAIIKILDELNVVVMGLDRRDYQHFYDALGFWDKGYRFNKDKTALWLWREVDLRQAFRDAWNGNYLTGNKDGEVVLESAEDSGLSSRIRRRHSSRLEISSIS